MTTNCPNCNAVIELKIAKIEAMPFEFKLETLSSKQRKVAALVAIGHSNKIIAHEMNICESTVKLHVRAIFKKLNVTNRTQLARAVINAQL